MKAAQTWRILIKLAAFAANNERKWQREDDTDISALNLHIFSSVLVFSLVLRKLVWIQVYSSEEKSSDCIRINFLYAITFLFLFNKSALIRVYRKQCKLV